MYIHIQPVWASTIGEHALFLHPVRLSKPSPSSPSASTGPATTLHPDQPPPDEVLVIGEQSMITITSTGAIRLQKKLDYHPAAVSPYIVYPQSSSTTSSSSSSSSSTSSSSTNPSSPDSSSASSSSSSSSSPPLSSLSQHILISSHEHAMLLYRSTDLLWSSRLPGSLLVQTVTAGFNGVNHMIVALRENGEVCSSIVVIVITTYIVCMCFIMIM